MTGYAYTTGEHRREAIADKAAPARSGVRLGWLDAAKGLGILFVVLGHAMGGLMDSPIGAGSTVLRDLFLGIYIFHMPLFFLLSGLLVAERIGRGRSAFFLSILAGVVYPYFLWSFIQYGVIYSAGSLVNRPVDSFWRPLLNLPLVSISQFWFLYVLAILHLAALVLVPRIGTRGFLIVALALRIALIFVHMPVMLRLAMTHGLFYAIGVWGGAGMIERFRDRLARRPLAVALAASAGGAAVLLAASHVISVRGPAFYTLHSWQISALAWRPEVVPLAAIAVAAFLAVAVRLRGTIADGLGYLGRRTMAIFILHVLFIAGTRILLGKLHLGMGLWPMLVACMVAGLIGPLLVHAVVRRITRSRITGLG